MIIYDNVYNIDYTPSHHKSSVTLSSAIPDHLLPLFRQPMHQIDQYLENYLPILEKSSHKLFDLSKKSSINDFCSSIQCRLLINGNEDKSFKYLGPAILDKLEMQKMFVQSIDLSSLLSDGTRVIQTQTNLVSFVRVPRLV